MEGKHVPRSWCFAVVPLAVLLVAGCAGDPAPAVPARTFPALRAGAAVPLEIEVLAQDAVEPAALRMLLVRAGFAAAAERTFVGGRDLRSVTARIVEFSSEQGASVYLRWLDTHARDLLGEAERGTAIALGDGKTASSYTAAPGGCCAKAMTTSFAAWRRGASVLSVLVVGAGADAGGLASLARGFDAATVATEET